MAETELQPGMPAPEFSLRSNQGTDVSLASLRGRKVVLYFYPKDDTPGCTKEACSFRDTKAAFDAVGAVILGVSKDSIASHDKFITKFNLNFPLLSDAHGTVSEAYGVWKEKNMYGKKTMGIERSTFLIDEQGRIVKIWRKVKVDGHTEDVLSAITAG